VIVHSYNEPIFRFLDDCPAIHGRVFETIDDVRKAVADFADTCNKEWLIEETDTVHDAPRAPNGSTPTSSARQNAVSCPEIQVRHN
jgi:hypothetical protein